MDIIYIKKVPAELHMAYRRDFETKLCFDSNEIRRKFPTTVWTI